MKIFIPLLALSAAFVVEVKSATISITNFDSVSAVPFFNPITDSSGNLLNSGIIVVGTYSVQPSNVSDVLGSNFTQAGSGSLSIISPGFFQGDITTPLLTAGDAFVGNSVYIVIGNGTTLANSTQLLSWQAGGNPDGDVFVADDPTGGPGSVAVRNSTGEARVGQETTFDFGSTGPGVQPALQLAAIPEPSTLILSALGTLALLRRKR